MAGVQKRSTVVKEIKVYGMIEIKLEQFYDY